MSTVAEQKYERQIAQQEQQITQLQAENRELQETVQWMHDLIWEIIERQWNLHRTEPESQETYINRGQVAKK